MPGRNTQQEKQHTRIRRRRMLKKMYYIIITYYYYKSSIRPRNHHHHSITNSNNNACSKQRLNPSAVSQKVCLSPRQYKTMYPPRFRNNHRFTTTLLFPTGTVVVASLNNKTFCTKQFASRVCILLCLSASRLIILLIFTISPLDELFWSFYLHLQMSPLDELLW